MASGHLGLLWRRRSIEKTIADPKTPPELKKKLELVVDVRRFAFEKLALKPSHAYETWTPVPGEALTWLAEAAPRTKLEPYLFYFPLIGSFPYKGYFRPELAQAEAARLEKKGYDATVAGASAYSSGLPISDPLPSNMLRWDDAGLAETLIHELTHGTVGFRNHSDFNEALAVWTGARGVEAYLIARDGPDSPRLKQWREANAAGEKREGLYRELSVRLKALYDGPATDADKLAQRGAIFDWARSEAKSRGLAPLREPLNNAVVLGHALYAPDYAPFDALFEKNERDWSKTIAALKALDKRDPLAALRAASTGASR